MSYAPTLVSAILTVVSTAIAYFFAGMIAYFCVMTSYLIVSVAKHFRPDISLQAMEDVEFRKIGELSLTVGISWILGVGLLLAQITVAPTNLMTAIQILAFLALTLMLLIVPLTATHDLIVKFKDKATKELGEMQWGQYHRIRDWLTARDRPQTEAPSTQMATVAALAQSLQSYQSRIDRLQGWPIDVSVVVQLAIAFAAQMLPTLLNSLLSEAILGH